MVALFKQVDNDIFYHMQVLFFENRHGETRINELEQTIDRLEAELRNCLNSTEPDLDSQLLEEYVK